MPLVQTQQFGELQYADDATVHFPHGLPGFELCHRFVFIQRPDLAPVVHLQSLETPEVCFPAMPIHAIDPNYVPVIAPEDEVTLGLRPSSPLNPAPVNPATLALALLAATAEGELTANLFAPIIINMETGTAVQAVRMDSLYSPHYSLEGAACS
ncbi:MAG: flagellar assembly protein FliW [Acidobacteriota bacterium]